MAGECLSTFVMHYVWIMYGCCYTVPGPYRPHIVCVFNVDVALQCRSPGMWPQDFTVGAVPPRLGGIKSYDTSDDEVILEVPLLWGSTCQVCVCGGGIFGLCEVLLVFQA